MLATELLRRGYDSTLDFEVAQEMRDNYVEDKHRYQLDRIPLYKKLAEERGIGPEASADTIRSKMWFDADRFKPDSKKVDNREYAELTRWLADRYHDQSFVDEIDLQGVDSLDSWLDKLNERELGVIHSSGTSGNFSYVPWDAETRIMFEQGMDNILESIGMFDGVFDFIALVPEKGNAAFAVSNNYFMGKEKEGKIGIFYRAIQNETSADLIRSMRSPTPYGSIRLRAKAKIAKKLSPGMMKKFYSGALDVLKERVEHGNKILIGGAPFQMLDLIEQARSEGRDINLPYGSAFMLGGGWKHHQRGDIGEDELVSIIKEEFGDHVSVFDGYGMTEKGVMVIKQLRGSKSKHFGCDYSNFHLQQFLDPFVQLEDGTITQEHGAEGNYGFSVPVKNRISTILTGDRVTLGRGCECGYTGYVLMDKVSRPEKKPPGCGTNPEDYGAG